MKMITRITLLFTLLLGSQIHLYSQVSEDELVDQLDSQIMEYEEITERINDLDDHLLYSANEFDEKASEITALLKDYSEVLAHSYNLYEKIQNDLDSFDAACRMLLEKRCPDQEKKFEAFLMEIEPVVEQAGMIPEVLESVDNRYDEKFMIKTFQKAEKEGEQTVADLESLKEDLIRLFESCQ